MVGGLCLLIWLEPDPARLDGLAKDFSNRHKEGTGLMIKRVLID
jgi:hypothetical protein